MEPDPERKNIYYAYGTPHFAIGQRAIVYVCTEGIWIWDCFAVLTAQLVRELKTLEKEAGKRILGIVLSHPHFYATSMSWAIALDTKVMISAQDVDWYQVSEMSLILPNFIDDDSLEFIHFAETR